MSCPEPSPSFLSSTLQWGWNTFLPNFEELSANLITGIPQFGARCVSYAGKTFYRVNYQGIEAGLLGHPLGKIATVALFGIYVHRVCSEELKKFPRVINASLSNNNFSNPVQIRTITSSSNKNIVKYLGCQALRVITPIMAVCAAVHISKRSSFEAWITNPFVGPSHF